MQSKHILGPLAQTWAGPFGAAVVSGGHYRAYATTSAIAPAANAVLANVRWVATPTVTTTQPPTTGPQVMVILRVAVQVAVVTAVTAQRIDPLVGIVQRAYTASETTNATAVTLTTNNAKMNTKFPTPTVTQFAVANLAAGITGGTSTADANPFGIAAINGTTLVGIGTGSNVIDLYRHDVAQGEYPLVHATNEGFKVQWGATALATGTVEVTVGVEWMESYQY